VNNIPRNAAAARLGVHRNTIAAWVKAGRLQSNPDGSIPVSAIETLERAIAEHLQAAGPAYTAAELLVQHAGQRNSHLLTRACEVAHDLQQLGQTIRSRGMVDPVANGELFETMRLRISELGAIDVELSAIDHLQDIAKAIALAPTQRAALERACVEIAGHTPAEAEALVKTLDDEQVQDRLAELPKLLTAREGEEHA
jgi:hypothetical protein